MKQDTRQAIIKVQKTRDRLLSALGELAESIGVPTGLEDTELSIINEVDIAMAWARGRSSP